MSVSEKLSSDGLARVCRLTIERDEEGEPVRYLPQNRYLYRDHVKLNKNGKGPFCRLVLPRLTDQSGVYVITLDKEVVYIGECQNFQEMFGQRGYGVVNPADCYTGGQSTVCKVNSRILRATLMNSVPDLWFIGEDDRGRKNVKANLISRFEPKWNGRQ